MSGKRFLAWCRREAVLVTAAVCAAVSAAAVPPSAAYLDYMDLRVLCLLLCLMAVVAGLQSCGVFLVLSQRLLAGEKNVRVLQLLLVLLPFFSSMLITNDVALITFVPFTLQILEMAGERARILPTVILQTAAANLGSMATPVGNPQNLFLCGHFHLSAGDFFSTLLPYTVVSLLALSAGALVGSSQSVRVRFPKPAAIQQPKLLAVLAALFVLCLLAVFHVVHYAVVTGVVVPTLLLLKRELLKNVDYSLLLTFVFFFIFAGNIGQIPALQQLLEGWMARSALLTSALASQIISNVPASLLLAGFTEDWRGLLLGVDLGGLGTPIASLASLISLKFYLRSPGAQPGRFLLWFSAVNFGGLAALLLLTRVF